MLANFSKVFNAFNNVKVAVKISNSPAQQSKSFHLNLRDNLSIVRQELEKFNAINDTLLFVDKFSEENNNSSEFAEISLGYEENFRLNEIVCRSKSGNTYILYLVQSSEINWKILNDLHQLDYGRTMTFDGITKANKKAFEMENCKLVEIGADGYQTGSVEFKSNEDQMMKTNLFFSANVNVQNFVKLGMSIGTSKNEKFNIETNSSYHFIKFSKISLKFSEYLKPTQEFIESVKDAIESKDPENFRKITEKFGQFIPTEVILGGRAHFDEFKRSTGYSTETSKEIAINIDDVRVGNSSNYLKGKSNYHNSKCTRLIGGKQLVNFDEEAWARSLNEDYRNWGCIEFREPISIFQLIPDDLRKQIIMSIGKRIRHLKFEDFNYHLEEFNKPKIFELKNMPSNIMKIIQNKDADCNIFATVIDTEESKNDFFNCQVLYPPNGKPSLIIHCIQKTSRKRECKLKIGWMVIGYYADFNFILSDFNTQLNILKKDFSSNNQNMINMELLNFEYNSFIENPLCLGIPVLTELNSSNYSLIVGHHFFNAQEENEEKNKIGACTFSYCLRKNHYVNLPCFTFYTLVIPNYPISDACDIISFECKNINLNDNYSNNHTEFSCLNPKFISLYSTKKTNCGPIFLKQRSGKIKIKFLNCKNKTCSVCTLILSENDIKCALFNPDISKVDMVLN